MFFGRNNFMNNNCCMNDYDRQQMQSIQEPTVTNCIEREFYHEVPQE